MRWFVLFMVAALASLATGRAADPSVTAYHGSPAHRQRRQISASARRPSCRSKQRLRACPTPPTEAIIVGQALSGNFVTPSLTDAAARTLHRDTRFKANVDGKIYAQPLYWRPPGSDHGTLIVATERDQVTALDAATGRPVWQVTLGTPAPLSRLGCGDIGPLGITGTPVIDARRHALYLDAMVLRDGAPRHLVFGLDLATGATLPGWPIDIGTALKARGIGFDPRIQGERGALALLDHRLFVPYGGDDGDCGPYHGIVAGLALGHPRLTAAWATRGKKGGIWAPGGISVADGALFVSTGNTVTGPAWADGEGVFRFGPDLARHGARTAYAPANWKQLDREDLDMSGVSPLPLDLSGAHRLLALGKDGSAYLLDRDDLGGVGGRAVVRQVAKSAIITATASFPRGGKAIVAFQARRALCPDGRFAGGIAALAVGADTIEPQWCAAFDGRGAPIVTTTNGTADPIVWAVGAQGDNRLHAWRGDTGQPLYTSRHTLPGVPEFQTILATTHRLYIAGAGKVVAYAWSAPRSAP